MYTKTTWVDNELPAINAENLNNIENGIKGNEAKIDALVLGENLKGEFTPSISQEYPLSPAINDSWYIDGLTGAGYEFTTGVLIGQVADNFDKLVYISTGWFLVEDTQNYVHNTGDETIAGVKTFSSSPIVPAPTTDLQASTKKYVDDAIAGSTLDINVLTEKTTPVDADELALADSAATFSLKKLTWANLKATLKAYFDALYAVLPSSVSVSGTATFTNTTNNIALTGIGSIGLEVGDVITVSGSVSNDKEFTVETITDANNIVVNYEHRGGTTAKSLVDETVSVTISLLSKYYNAPIGLGQAWCEPATARAAGVTYTNNTGRSIEVAICAYGGAIADRDMLIYVNGLLVSRNLISDASAGNLTTTEVVDVPNGDTHTLQWSSSGVISFWAELR